MVYLGHNVQQHLRISLNTLNKKSKTLNSPNLTGTDTNNYTWVVGKTGETLTSPAAATSKCSLRLLCPGLRGRSALLPVRYRWPPLPPIYLNSTAHTAPPIPGFRLPDGRGFGKRTHNAASSHGPTFSDKLCAAGSVICCLCHNSSGGTAPTLQPSWPSSCAKVFRQLQPCFFK